MKVNLRITEISSRNNNVSKCSKIALNVSKFLHYHFFHETLSLGNSSAFVYFTWQHINKKDLALSLLLYCCAWVVHLKSKTIRYFLCHSYTSCRFSIKLFLRMEQKTKWNSTEIFRSGETRFLFNNFPILINLIKLALSEGLSL